MEFVQQCADSRTLPSIEAEPFVIHLTDVDSQRLDSHFSGIPIRGYQKNPAAVTEVDEDGDCVQGFEVLAFDALQASGLLDRVPSIVAEHGVAIIRNIDYGETAPTNTSRCMHNSAVPEAMIAAITKQLGGKLVGYREKILYSHPLFHDIRPIPGGKEGSNGDGKVDMMMHMDMSCNANRPDLIFLACIQEGPDAEVKTPFLSNKTLYRALEDEHPEDIPVLRDEENFIVKATKSAGGGRVLMPLLEGTAEHPVFNLRADAGSMLAVPGCEQASLALQHLQALMTSLEDSRLHLRRGDLVVMDNLAMLHRRTSFKAMHSPEDRQLMRAYGKMASDDIPFNRIFLQHGNDDHGASGM